MAAILHAAVIGYAALTDSCVTGRTYMNCTEKWGKNSNQLT